MTRSDVAANVRWGARAGAWYAVFISLFFGVLYGNAFWRDHEKEDENGTA